MPYAIVFLCELSSQGDYKANGLNPQKYLEYLFEARPGKNMSDEGLEKKSLLLI